MTITEEQIKELKEYKQNLEQQQQKYWSDDREYKELRLKINSVVNCMNIMGIF